MRILEIIRLEENAKYGTFGVLKIDKEAFCWTLEPADLLNKIRYSSIPAQQYICERVNSAKFGETFEVKDVPGRTHILFHAGNTIDDTSGCILLGRIIGYLKNDRAVLNSGNTFQDFMKRLQGQSEMHLTIKQMY